MKVYSELKLTEFDFWSGAKDHCFTYSELKELEDIFEDLFPQGCSETEINDLFWFEQEYLCTLLGINYNRYMEREEDE